MYLPLIVLPLIASIISGLLGRKISREGSQIITSLSIIMSCILAIIGYYEIGLSNSGIRINLSQWISSEILLINWGILIDSLSISMIVTVLIISASVHIYSIGYMEQDPHNPRFFSYLSLFTFFMLLLVAGDNFLLIFIGWEGVGVCSYLLINFWFIRIEANKAAIKALIMNRIGDWGYSIALYTMAASCCSWDNGIINSVAPELDPSLIGLISLAVLVAAMGKSAQFGLHTWLADAMEGPTPVSALIHAATMVTAGVYLLLRASPLLEYSSTGLMIITVIGSLTAIFAASTALFQNDIKKVIAYSTCSQLGYLFIAIGCSNYSTCIFHLVNHAFFKALLFLSAGSVLHALNDQQDMRKMGGLVNILPFTYCNMLVGSLSLMALPFLTGYYSKDVIIETAFGQFFFIGSLAYWSAIIAATATAAYSVRLIYLTFLIKPNGPRKSQGNLSRWPKLGPAEGDPNSGIGTAGGTLESSLIMSYPLIGLGIASIGFGYLFKDLFIGLGTNFWDNSLFMNPENSSRFLTGEFHEWEWVKLLPIGVSVIGGILGVIVTTRKLPPIKLLEFLAKAYRINPIANNLLLLRIFQMGYITYKELDRGFIELLGPYGSVKKIKNLGYHISQLDSGFIPHYALYIVAATVITLWISDIKLLYLIISFTFLSRG